MAKITETYVIGDKTDLSIEELLKIMQDMYRDLAIAVNKKPDVYTRDTDGQATDTFLSNGDININLSTDKIEMISNHTNPTTVVWTQLSP